MKANEIKHKYLEEELKRYKNLLIKIRELDKQKEVMKNKIKDFIVNNINLFDVRSTEYEYKHYWIRNNIVNKPLNLIIKWQSHKKDSNCVTSFEIRKLSVKSD